MDSNDGHSVPNTDHPTVLQLTICYKTQRSSQKTQEQDQVRA